MNSLNPKKLTSDSAKQVTRGFYTKGQKALLVFCVFCLFVYTLNVLTMFVYIPGISRIYLLIHVDKLSLMEGADLIILNGTTSFVYWATGVFLPILLLIILVRKRIMAAQYALIAFSLLVALNFIPGLPQFQDVVGQLCLRPLTSTHCSP